MIIGQIWDFKERKIMKKILLALTLMLFSTSAFAGSCPMMSGKVKLKIEQA